MVFNLGSVSSSFGTVDIEEEESIKDSTDFSLTFDTHQTELNNVSKEIILSKQETKRLKDLYTVEGWAEPQRRIYKRYVFWLTMKLVLLLVLLAAGLLFSIYYLGGIDFRELLSSTGQGIVVSSLLCF